MMRTAVTPRPRRSSELPAGPIVSDGALLQPLCAQTATGTTLARYAQRK